MGVFKYVAISEITNNLDSKRIPLNAEQRKLKESNPIYPYVGANNILGYIDEYIFDDKILCVAEDGGSWGRNQKCAFIINEKCWVNNHAHVLTSKENLHLEYLCYYLNFEDLTLFITGATRGKLNKGTLNKIKIPLPPLKTQKQIASILDDAQALQQKTEQLLKEYDELAQSIFLDMFGDPVTNPKGWEMDLLKDVALINMGQSPKGSSYNDQGNGAPLLNGPTEFGVKFPKEKQWTSEPRKMSTKGDILFCVRGATAGRLNWSDKEYCIGRGLASIRSKGEVSDEYLYILLERMYDYFQKTSVGSTFINISRDDLGKVKVPRTTVKFQNQFAEKIKLIEQQKELAKQELEESEDLFQALLQKAFKGELV